jgi:hypothetical protein
LIEYAEGLNNDKFKSVKDAADDSAKFIAFKKTDDVEIIVRTVLEHKNKAALDNTDKAKRDEIVTRMKVTANTGYDQDHSKNVFKRERYGNPEEPEKLTKDQISNFLLDEKTKNITKQNES